MPVYCADIPGAQAKIFEMLGFGVESLSRQHLINAVNYLKATYALNKRNLARAEKVIKKQERAEKKRKLEEAAAALAAEEAAEAEAKRIKKEAKAKSKADAPAAA